MGLIKDWLPGFLNRYRQRWAPTDWPAADSEDHVEFARIWYDAFMKLDPKPRESEADTASIRLGPDPPRWRNDHLPRVLAEIRAVRAANAVASPPDTREAAESGSRDCPHCGGCGHMRVYHRLFAGDTGGYPQATIEDRHGLTRAIPTAVMAHCVCPLGRWTRSKFRDVTLLGRIPDGEHILSHRSSWLADPPAGRTPSRANGPIPHTREGLVAGIGHPVRDRPATC